MTCIAALNYKQIIIVLNAYIFQFNFYTLKFNFKKMGLIYLKPRIYTSQINANVVELVVLLKNIEHLRLKHINYIEFPFFLDFKLICTFK